MELLQSLPHRRRYSGPDNRLARHLYLLIPYGSGSPIRKSAPEGVASDRTQTGCELASPIPSFWGSPPQPPLCRLRPTIWLYHGNFVCQYLFCTIHHAATLRTLSPIVQPLLWNQCDSNGYLFSNIDKIAYYGTGFIYRKPGHVVSICAVNGALASGL